MNISWILADDLLIDPTIDIADLKRLGTFWGSWRTWRAFQTDNVICHNQNKAAELIKRDFQRNCNFYIPNSVYTSLAHPNGVRLYEGEFVHDVVRQEEIVAMHLAASTSDVILLLGFDWQEQSKNPNRLLEHHAHVYRTLIKYCIENNSEVQWVLVDHPDEIMKSMSKISNLTKDTMDTALSLRDI